MKFRNIQFLSIATILGYWGVRFITHPHHLHLSMLLMAAITLAVSEVSYAAGKAESKKKKETV
jgi:hypothetical protein